MCPSPACGDGPAPTSVNGSDAAQEAECGRGRRLGWRGVRPVELLDDFRHFKWSLVRCSLLLMHSRHRR